MGPLGFQTSILLQSILKKQKIPFGANQKFSEKKLKMGILNSLIVPKM